MHENVSLHLMHHLGLFAVCYGNTVFLAAVTLDNFSFGIGRFKSDDCKTYFIDFVDIFVIIC